VKKLLPSQLGAEPKKVIILGVILVGAGVYYVMNRTPSPDVPTTVAANVTPDPVALKSLPDPAARISATTPDTPPATGKRASKGGMAGMTGGNSEAFRPSLKPKDGVDVTRTDPTLRLDLLAKVREVALEGGSRSLFDYSPAPAPPTPAVDPIKVPPPLPVGPQLPPTPPTPAVPSKAVEPPKPPPPPIPLKYYGFGSNKPGEGPRRGFFLMGETGKEDIYVAAEGETVKERYKVIRFGVNSVVMEDTTNQSQQTLPLVEELKQ
jgi:hypothetical protein